MNLLKSSKTFLTKTIDLLISKLPSPLFNLYIGIAVFFNPKLGDILDNSNVTTQDGKTLITRPDGHIVIDEKGGVRIL